jgi:hypothetical protein
MRLHHWTHARKEIEFDVSTGQARIITLYRPRRKESDCSGYSTYESDLFGRREHFAVFKNAEGIAFYAGKQHWQLNDPAVKIFHTRPLPFLSRFTVTVLGEIEYRITYTHFLRTLFLFIDPTYDKIDQDADFFLEFVAEQAHSEEWLKFVESHWTDTTQR